MMSGLKVSFLREFFCLVLILASTDGAPSRSKSSHGQQKLLGGKYEVRNGTHSYLVSLRLMPRELHRCGGFLISRMHVITVASCVYGVSERALYAYVNPLRLDDEGAYYGIDKIYTHPDFGLTPRVNDIAILTLSNEIAETFITPLSLTSRQIVPQQKSRVYIYGWGYRNQEIPVSDASFFRLHYLQLRIKSASLCSLADGEMYGCETICLGGSHNFSTERVDIGTPVVYQFRKVPYAVGMIVSTTSRGVKVAPFMNLREYSGWIEEVIESLASGIDPVDVEEETSEEEEEDELYPDARQDNDGESKEPESSKEYNDNGDTDYDFVYNPAEDVVPRATTEIGGNGILTRSQGTPDFNHFRMINTTKMMRNKAKLKKVGMNRGGAAHEFLNGS